MTSLPMVVVYGFAGWLAANDAASWPDVTGPYTEATEWPVYPGPDMLVTPHRQIVVTPTTSRRDLGTIRQGIQVRYRGRPDDPTDDVISRAQRVMDMCYPNGHPRVQVSLGLIRAGQIYPGDETFMGRDANRRAEYVQNFVIRYRPPVGVPTLGYSVLDQERFVTSPDGSVRTIVTMTQAEFDQALPDPTRAVLIIPEPPNE